MPSSPLRVLFVNSGILGHRSVGRLLREAVANEPGIEATHVDLSEGLTTGERVVRRLMCAGPASGASFPGAALTFPRFRHEMHAGVLAERRIRTLERAGKRFDVIHFHTQATAWASLDRMRRTPSIVSIDASQRGAAEQAPWWARLDYVPGAVRDLAVFHAAASVICTSEWAAEDVARYVPSAGTKVHVMPYPVPLEGFDPKWIAERAARPSTGPVHVLFVGGDFPRKGGLDLLDAWRQGGFASGARLTLVTDWPLRDLPDAVEVRRGVAAYTPEWFDLWRRADVFAMPTRGEAFGVVFQEAAAAGLPSIAGRVGAVPEVVKDGATGMLVRPGEVEDIVFALGLLVGNAKLRRMLGTQARERIAREARPDAYSRKLIRLIRQAASGGKA